MFEQYHTKVHIDGLQASGAAAFDLYKWFVHVYTRYFFGTKKEGLLSKCVYTAEQTSNRHNRSSETLKVTAIQLQ